MCLSEDGLTVSSESCLCGNAVCMADKTCVSATSTCENKPVNCISGVGRNLNINPYCTCGSVVCNNNIDEKCVVNECVKSCQDTNGLNVNDERCVCNVTVCSINH